MEFYSKVLRSCKCGLSLGCLMQLQFYLMIWEIDLEKEFPRAGPGSPSLDPWRSSQEKHTARRTQRISRNQKDPEGAF